jgi:hypothetical protein
MEFAPGDGFSISGHTNGYQVWTQNNGFETDNYSAVTYDTIFHFREAGYDDLIFTISPYSVNGSGRDTVGFTGGCIFNCIPDGFNELAWWIETTPTTIGDTLCIDSCTFGTGGGPWLWGTTGGYLLPYWDGPHCFVVGEGAVVDCGDADGSTAINLLDVTYLINYLYKGGPPPTPECAGDVNETSTVNILDVTYLINYLYKGGPPPGPNCCN